MLSINYAYGKKTELVRVFYHLQWSPVGSCSSSRYSKPLNVSRRAMMNGAKPNFHQCYFLKVATRSRVGKMRALKQIINHCPPPAPCQNLWPPQVIPVSTLEKINDTSLRLIGIRTAYIQYAQHMTALLICLAGSCKLSK